METQPLDGIVAQNRECSDRTDRATDDIQRSISTSRNLAHGHRVNSHLGCMACREYVALIVLHSLYLLVFTRF